MEKENLLKKIGGRIREIRKCKGLSQVDLSIKVEALGGKMDTTNISRLEAGRTNPTIYMLLRLAKGLGVPLCELIRGVEDIEPESKVQECSTRLGD